MEEKTNNSTKKKFKFVH